MANQFLKLRRSSVPGKRPDTGSLDYGEIALNTYDGLAFMKKSGSNGEEIVAIGSTGSFTGSFFGSLQGTSSWAINALTASSADNFTVRGTLTAQTIVVQVITSSTEFVTGSLIVSGALNVFGGITGSLNGTASWATNAQTASYVPASAIAGLNLSRITTGSITASVDVDPNNLFLIKSGSNTYFNIANNSDTTLYSNQFIVRNFTTQNPVLTVSQSIVQFATQSSNPTNPAKGGDIWFTSTELYVGLN
jgi:hypothetical protein